MPAVPGKASSGAGVPGSAGDPPASGPQAHRCVEAGKMPAVPEKAPSGAVVPGSAGDPPAPGRRPAMDDPPQAHRCVEAGKMPAVPGEAPSGAGVPGSAGDPPASGPQAHRCVEAGKMPAVPGEGVERSGCPWERGRPARKWAAGPPLFKRGDARVRIRSIARARRSSFVIVMRFVEADTISTSSPGFRPRSSTSALGSRTARLLHPINPTHLTPWSAGGPGGSHLCVGSTDARVRSAGRRGRRCRAPVASVARRPWVGW